MSFRHTDWPYWMHKNPEVLKDRILAAFIEHNGQIVKVIKSLGLTNFSYYYYVRHLGLKSQLISLRESMDTNLGKKRAALYSDERPRPRGRPSLSEEAPTIVSDVSDSGVWSV